MEERSELSKSSGHKSSGHSRKSSKKRSGRKGNGGVQNWSEEAPLMENGPPIDYRQMFWQQQSGLPAGTVPPPHIQPHGGQRLFAAMSDPSVCGYSPVPMAYAMEPVSVPPLYPLYQPVTRPNYRTFRGRPRRRVAQNGPTASQPHNALTNGYSSLQENRSNYSNPPAYQNGDYASLPPNANVDRSSAGDELNTEHRRYSDPGLGPADVARPANSEDSDSGDDDSSVTTIGKNKLVLSLVEQMTALRETNSRMFKELHETRTDLECVKSELARLKRGGSSDYQPGMLSDIVRDMREANKVLDEAMITKVNAMVDEQNRQRTMEFEKLRDQIAKISEEKDANHRRIVELEEAVAALKLTSTNEGREIAAFEEENLALRRELQEARALRNMAENHVAKLEKLVDILRKKVNGASDEETVAHIRELVTTGVNRVHGAKISADKIVDILGATGPRDDLKDAIVELARNELANENNEEEEDDDDDDDAISSCDPDTTSSANNHPRNVVSANESVCSNSSLVGPVTDL